MIFLLKNNVILFFAALHLSPIYCVHYPNPAFPNFFVFCEPLPTALFFDNFPPPNPPAGLSQAAIEGGLPPSPFSLAKRGGGLVSDAQRLIEGRAVGRRGSTQRKHLIAAAKSTKQPKIITRHNTHTLLKKSQMPPAKTLYKKQ